MKILDGGAVDFSIFYSYDLSKVCRPDSFKHLKDLKIHTLLGVNWDKKQSRWTPSESQQTTRRVAAG